MEEMIMTHWIGNLFSQSLYCTYNDYIPQLSVQNVTEYVYSVSQLITKPYILYASKYKKKEIEKGIWM